ADTILRFAHEYRVGQVVIGKPGPIPFWKRLKGEKSVAEQLIRRAKGVTITVVDAESSERTASTPGEAAPHKPAGMLSQLLSPQRVMIWDDPVSKADVRNRLVEAIVATAPAVNRDIVLSKLIEREAQGSTFLNEGVALPHARINGLESPQVALGL